MLKTDWNICYLTMTFIYFWSFCKLNTGVMRLHIRILCQHTFARTPFFKLWIGGGHLTESVSVCQALEADPDYLETFDEFLKAQNRDMLVQWSLILISNHIVQNWQTKECTLSHSHNVWLKIQSAQSGGVSCLDFEMFWMLKFPELLLKSNDPLLLFVSHLKPH
jgi:hypothetical protein